MNYIVGVLILAATLLVYSVQAQYPGSPCIPEDPEHYGLYAPHPFSCFLYLQCDNGYFVERPCPATLEWNAELNTCDWPWAANCVLFE